MHTIQKREARHMGFALSVALAIVILAYTTTFVTQPLAGLWSILGAPYLFLSSLIFGRRFFGYMKSFQAFCFGSLLEIGWLIVASGIALLFGSLAPIVIFSILIMPIFFLRTDIVGGSFFAAVISRARTHRPFSHYLLLASIVVFMIMLFLFLTYGRHEISSVSPWQHLSSILFPIYFTCIITALTLAIYYRRLAWYYVTPLLLLSVGVLPLVYPLGFGFDPFVHKATEHLIVQFGHIEPRPYFYSGYYGLVTVLHYVSGLSVNSVDTYLLMALLALFVPAFIFIAFRQLLQERYLALLATPLFLLIPYGDLIQSTPQSASFVFALISIILVFLRSRWPLLPAWSTLIAPVTALMLHPLSGIPILLFALCALAREHTARNSAKLVIALYFALSILALPCAFMLAGGLSSDFSLSLGFNAAVLERVAHVAIYRFATLYDLVYTIGNNMIYVLVLFSLIGYWTATDDMKKALRLLYIGCAGTALTALTVAVVLQFNFATSSEQFIFGGRLFRLAIYFLLPAVILGISECIKRARRKGAISIFSLIFLISALVTISWYMAYPRFDTREQSKGYSPSAADFEAVRFIHDDGEGTRYVVLANQSVSAVALQEFGFLKYYGNSFYYPIPTTSPLYHEYLRMTDLQSEPKAISTALKNRLNVERVYFVLNGYWSDAEALALRHQQRALTTLFFGDGQVTVFRY